MTPNCPLLQPKLSVASSSKPDLHVQPGQFIPSESELMSLKSKENVQELMERYLPGYEDKKTGNVRFLSPTARTKITATLAMKVMGERVAIDATMEKSFDKDD